MNGLHQGIAIRGEDGARIYFFTLLCYGGVPYAGKRERIAIPGGNIERLHSAIS